MARVDVQFASAGGVAVPSADHIRQWAESALDKGGMKGYGLTVRIVDEEEMLALNAAYRNRSKTTNVLSFPFESVPGIEQAYAGDVVICQQVVSEEAREQGKALDRHFAHMVVHGTLHLCGFDHQNDEQAEHMERLENRILAEAGFI